MVQMCTLKCITNYDMQKYSEYGSSETIKFLNIEYTQLSYMYNNSNDKMLIQNTWRKSEKSEYICIASKMIIQLRLRLLRSARS